MVDYNTIKIDRLSYELGMINCFAEMVACGVKKLALSPPILPEDYDVIGKASNDIVKGFGIKTYLEHSLIITDIQSEDFTRGKWSILYFKNDEVLNEYLALKDEKEKLVALGKYDSEAHKRIAREFGKLLSYPLDVIEEKISANIPPTPYTLV